MSLCGVVIGFVVVDLVVAALGLFFSETMLLVGAAGLVTGQVFGVAIMWFSVAPRLQRWLGEEGA